MRDTIKAIFQNLGQLREIPPTENNVMLLADCYLKLRGIYNALPDEKPKDDEPEIQIELEDEQPGEE